MSPHTVEFVQTLLEYDRAAIAEGQWHRLVTGHFVHHSLDHLFWDLTVFVVLLPAAVRLTGRLCIAALGIAALTISLGMWGLQPQFATYRGLSGLDSTLFAIVVTCWMTRSLQERRWATLCVAGVSFIGFTGKAAFETATGVCLCLFVDAADAGFTPVPFAHAVGGAVGMVVTCCVGIARGRLPHPSPGSPSTPTLLSDGHQSTPST